MTTPIPLGFDPDTESISFVPGRPAETVSGRITTPTPKRWSNPLTERKAMSWLSRLNKWLAHEGNVERAERKLDPCGYDGKNLSDADRREIAHLLADPDWLTITGRKYLHRLA